MHRSCGAGSQMWLRRWYLRAADEYAPTERNLGVQDRSQPAEVFVGVDIAKGKHFVCAVSARGEALFFRPVTNDEADIRQVIDEAATHGHPALVVDTISSAAVLALTVAAECGIPVAYVSGLVMRRAADLYAGAAKTDPKDAQVLAYYARRNAGPADMDQRHRRAIGPSAYPQRAGHRPGWGRHQSREPPERRPLSLNPPIHVPKTNPDQGDLRDPPLTGSCSSSQDRTILTNSYRRRSGGISTISPCPLRPPHRWIQA